MKNIRIWVLTALTSALLAGCGGDDPYMPGSGSPSGAPTTKGNFSAVVSFGDSLSDVGAYAPATSVTGNGAPPFFGGKFTTNTTNLATGANTAGVWVENLAVALSTPAKPIYITPAEVGFAGQSVACPAAANPALAGTCTGYGQGGSRVTNPIGIGNDGKGGAALTVPVKTQIANHLARFGSFKDTDLIVVFGGNNDVFVQFGNFTAAATAIQTDAATGKISADEANRRLLDAQLAAQGELKIAATELAGYVRNEILAKGGKYVAVWNLPDSVNTPFGSTVPASVRPVLTGLVDIFNLWLREGLTNLPVQLVDANTSFKDAYTNPTKYGFVNNTVPACDAAKIAAITGGAIKDGSSLFCNATPGAPFNTLRDGADITTWQFADGVHPTVGGQKVISTQALELLKSFGWI
jgi:outer membrane lipase/esterase